MNLRDVIAPASLAALVALACGGCMLRSDEELESSGLLIAGQLELREYPATSQGLTDQLIVPRPGEQVRIEEELTEDDPSWSRPDRSCLEIDPNDFPYDGYLLTNHTDQQATVVINAEPIPGDHPLAIPMIYVYEDWELPDHRLRCVGSGQARVVLQLDPRTSYYVVITSWDNDILDTAFGEYAITFTRA